VTAAQARLRPRAARPALRRVLSAATALVLTLLPASAGAWGFTGHRLVGRKAIRTLPEPLRRVFEGNAAYLSEQAITPDLTRSGPSDPDHFLDMDAFGAYPFEAISRVESENIARLGKDITAKGRLPWKIDEVYRALVQAYRDRDTPRVLAQAATLCHLIADAHVPLHATDNYDGQLTGQRGIHSRFEAFLFERYRDQWTIAPKPISPIRNPRDFIFDVVLQGTQLAPPILKADLDAIGSRDEYDDAYYAAFFKANRAVVERRLNESIAASAAMIAGAWEAAGKPAVPVNPRPTTQRRRR
jgi:hypothetical protein